MNNQISVLVVDDCLDVRDWLQAFLTEMGFAVLVQSEISGAMATLKRNRVDLIISDVNMPRGSGLDLLVSLRNEGSIVPFIVMSADGHSQEHIRELGGSCFIQKPFSRQNLVTRLKACLADCA